MDSKFVVLCISLAISAAVTTSFADVTQSLEGPPPIHFPLPSWQPLPTDPPPPTKNVTQQDIDSICSSSEDPKFCQNTISSIPETNRTNLKDLQTSVIDKAVEIFNRTLEAFPGLIDSIKEPELKDAHFMCSQHYYNAREDFMDTAKSLNKKVFYLPTYHIAIDLMKNAIIELNTCEIDIEVIVNKPGSPYTTKKDELTRYAHLVSAIGKYLYDSLASTATA